jgi:hypothetical protein
MVALLLMMPLVMGTSCGSDEPDWLVGYYMTINSETRLNLTENDESQGTSSQPYADVLSNTIVKMRTALNEFYQEPTTHANDAVILTALDNIYKQYKAMYGHLEKNTVCVVTIYRAAMDGEIVKRSTPLKTYHFGALPPGIE